MRKIALLILLAPFYIYGQGPNVTSWFINTTGHQAQYYTSTNSIVDLNDSSEVQQVCYNTDTVYVRANLLAKYIMGDWPGDPFVADGKNKSYVFPRNPTYPTTNHGNKPVGIFGLAINGVAIYDDGDGKSYKTSTNRNENNGGGVWNQIAWVAHIGEMDAGNAHPDPNNIYHHHHSPIQLCSVTDASQHSPIIGWSFDGFPIYGPFGYSNATVSGSGIRRMTASWQLRNITTRTTLYTGVTTTQAGPNVGTSFPLGTYIEDYEYIANLGDLDYYNGRYCVTPEFPSGTYAYFLNVDASGNPQYPSMVGPKFYGRAISKNFGASGGNASKLKNSSCYSPATGIAASIARITHVSCSGGSTGQAVVTVTSGSGTFTYAWSPSGGSTATATGLSAGAYYCIVSNGTYTTTVNVAITVPSAITSTSNVNHGTCSGTGSVNVTVSGGTTPYTYAWSNGASSSIISSLSVGMYTLTVTDGKACKITSSYAITTPSAISSMGKIIHNSCSGNSMGSVNVTISGGTTPYSYHWSNGSNSQNISALSAATYTLTVTDFKGCKSSGTYTVTTPSPISPLSNISHVACFGNSSGAVNTTISGGTSPYSYLWSTGAVSAGIASTSSGMYNLTITDINGCKNVSTYTITTPSSLTRNVSVTHANCSISGTVSITVTGGAIPYNYYWSNGSNTPNISSLTAGSYTLTITDFNGCKSIGTYVVTTPSTLVLSGVIVHNLCADANSGAITTTISGGASPYGFNWSNGATSQNIFSLSSGMYNVTVMDALGCKSAGSYTITSPSAVNISGSLSHISCFGNTTGSVNITITGGTPSFSFTWAHGATSQNISPLSAGFYNVTITDLNGCKSTRGYTITTPSSITNNGSVFHSNCGAKGSITTTILGGTLPYTYAWNNGEVQRNLSSISGGSYTLTVTDFNGCKSIKSYTVTSTSPLNHAATTVHANCTASGAINLSISGGSAPYSYSWNNGANTQTIASLSAGTYAVTVTDFNGCKSTGFYTLTLPSSINTTITGRICQGDLFKVGTKSYSVTGIYLDVLKSKSGCDSSITTQLVVEQLNKPVVASSQGNLSVDIANASYQWKECLNNQLVSIEQATNQTFAASPGKSYAVEVTKGVCVTVSTCLGTSLSTAVDSGTENLFSVYPNPAGSFVHIAFQNNISALKLVDLSGKVLYEVLKLASNDYTLDVSIFNNGVYILQFEAVDGKIYHKILSINK